MAKKKSTKRKRSRSRRRGYKVKKKTLYTILSSLLIGAAGLIFLSFFNQQGLLGPLFVFLSEFFGIGVYLIPFNLVTIAFWVIGSKTFLSQPNLSVGIGIVTFSFIALARSGSIGFELWTQTSALITAIGAGFIYLGAFVIGWIVFFNTSLAQALDLLATVLQVITQAITGTEGYKRAKGKDKDVKRPLFSFDAFTNKGLTVKGGSPVGDTDAVKTASQVQINKPPKLSTQSQLGSSIVANPPQSAKTIWEYPPLSLLGARPGDKADRGDLKNNAHTIERTLESFGVAARVVEVNLGPAVTQYALEIALGTKLSKITALSNDLALALAAPTGQIRIEAPIPGRSLVGIEIPNRSLEFVTLKQMLQADAMRSAKSKLTVALGLDVSGNPVVTDIGRMPHVLIAGTTGSGKSVLLNAWICSFLFRATPDEVRLIMVDPKRVELVGYNGIPHLLTPVIVESDKILSALKWALQEMDRRYKQFSEVKVRNIDGFNELSGFQALPYIIILIDELADLMAYAAVEVEDVICRLAQMARATGIHLVIATQRPSVDVITGLIKANIPARIAFNVSSMVDSRVILDMPGAEKLLGRGDMLYIPPDQAKPRRIQGTFVSDAEVQKLVEFLKSKNAPVQYTEEVTSIPVSTKGGRGSTGTGDDQDELFEDAVREVCQHDRASASLLQRRLSIGYARAARILDQLEAAGVVGPPEGSKPRDVLIRSLEEYYARLEAQQVQSAHSSPPQEPGGQAQN